MCVCLQSPTSPSALSPSMVPSRACSLPPSRSPPLLLPASPRRPRLRPPLRLRSVQKSFFQDQKSVVARESTGGQNPRGPKSVRFFVSFSSFLFSPFPMVSDHHHADPQRPSRLPDRQGYVATLSNSVCSSLPFFQYFSRIFVTSLQADQ